MITEEQIKEYADKWHQAWSRTDSRTSWFEIDIMIQNLIRTVAAEARKDTRREGIEEMREVVENGPHLIRRDMGHLVTMIPVEYVYTKLKRLKEEE